MAESTQKKKPKSSATRGPSVSAARAKETPEERQEKARKAALSGTPEERRERARNAGRASGEKRRVEAEARRRQAELDAKRSAAAVKGWETKRRENPERYPPPKPKPEPKKKTKRKKRGKDKYTPEQRAAFRARSLKSAATKRIQAAEREELARKYREQLERNRRSWSSDLVYILRPGGGSIGSWVKEVIDFILADAQAAGANPLAGPWRVAGVVEGSLEGVGSFDVTVTGTIHERAAALAAALVDASARGGVDKRKRSPDRKGAGSTGGGRGAVAMDAAAEAERQRAVAEFSQGGSEPGQSARVTTLAAPPDAAVWRSYQAPDDDEQAEDFDDDDVPF